MIPEQGYTAHGRGFLKAFWIELALYVLLAAWLLSRGSSPLAVLLVVLSTFAMLRLVMVLGNVIPTWKARSPKTPEQEIGLPATLAMILREWWAAMLTYPFLFAFEPRWVPTNPPKGLPHKGLPIVLVPGFFTNRGYLKAWRDHLIATGYSQVYAVSPEPIFDSVEKNAQHVARFVDAVLADTGARHVVLIGHSMGGLVIRLYLHRFGGMNKAALAIGVGSPFRGTVLARGKEGMGPIVSQLTDENPWARTLMTEIEAVPCPVPFVALWSPHDTIVAPQSGSRVAEHYGRNVALPGIGHMEMVNNRSVMKHLVHELDTFYAVQGEH